MNDIFFMFFIGKNPEFIKFISGIIGIHPETFIQINILILIIKTFFFAMIFITFLRIPGKLEKIANNIKELKKSQ